MRFIEDNLVDEEQNLVYKAPQTINKTNVNWIIDDWKKLPTLEEIQDEDFPFKDYFILCRMVKDWILVNKDNLIAAFYKESDLLSNWMVSMEWTAKNRRKPDVLVLDLDAEFPFENKNAEQLEIEEAGNIVDVERSIDPVETVVEDFIDAEGIDGYDVEQEGDDEDSDGDVSMLQQNLMPVLQMVKEDIKERLMRIGVQLKQRMKTSPNSPHYKDRLDFSEHLSSGDYEINVPNTAMFSLDDTIHQTNNLQRVLDDWCHASVPQRNETNLQRWLFKKKWIQTLMKQ